MKPSIQGRLRAYVRALNNDEALSPFINSLNRVGEAYLFGGAPRDVSFVGRRLVNDLDIFVSGPIDYEEVSRVSKIVKKTNFGGLRLLVGPYDVDVWELSKSHAFKYDAASYVSVTNLLKSVCFSTDGIAVSLESGSVIKTTAFTKSLEHQRLDFVVPPSKIEPVVGARIARLVLKLHLELTPSVASYFVRCAEEFGVSSLIDAESRWGHRRILNEFSVEQVKNEIEVAIKKAFRIIKMESENSGDNDKAVSHNQKSY